jgi:hypothetical protein
MSKLFRFLFGVVGEATQPYFKTCEEARDLLRFLFMDYVTLCLNQNSIPVPH